MSEKHHPFRDKLSSESPSEVSSSEARQNKESLAGVFDSLIKSNLRLVSGARRTFFVNAVCVVLTTAAALSTAANLYYNRQETRELIAALRSNCPPGPQR